jgi:hypothetical protein
MRPGGSPVSGSIFRIRGFAAGLRACNGGGGAARNGGTRFFGIENVRKAVLRGLCEAAKACGCKPSFGQEGGDVLWTLRGEPFFAFQIHEESLRRETARKLRKGRARLRWVAVVKKGGYVKFVPRKARRVSEEADSD